MNPRSLGVAISISLLLTIVPITGVLAGTLEIPHSPTPSDESSAVSVFANLKWTAGDPGSNNSYTYTVYFGTTNPPPRVAENQTGKTYKPGILASSTTYYWQIVAWNQTNVRTIGPVWSFTTVENQAPFIPRLAKAPLNVGIGFSLNFSAITADPEGDMMYFQWEWGDGRVSQWLGPYMYGQECVCPNSWINKGTYSVRVRAQDSHYAISAWTTPILVSIAPQVHMVALEPGYMYI